MSPPDELIWPSLPVPGLVLDGRDRIEALNPAAELFFNATQKALAGAPLWDRLAVDAPLDEAFSRVRANQAPLFINDVDVSSGERAPVLCSIQIAPLSDRSGRILVLVSPREIAGRLGRAQSVKTAAKSAIGMAEMLAHEIKNPLAGITGAAQLLSMTLKGEDLELTDLIVAESRRIVKLLEQVEQFGNVRPPECHAVNIHDVLDRARRSAAVGFAANMVIEDDYDPSLPCTWGDGDQLLQVFQNLLRNAAQAAGAQGGRIRLRTFYEQSLRLRHPDGSGKPIPLQVEIIDNGPGLPPEIAADIFDPFVSGRENGTGLGLALVSKIISEHDGWITVDSVPGHTVFRVSLPIAPKPTKDED
ncbi:two-component system nitrogen regulation sensor histidine kinase GlnL [Rhodovulum imhoffii]|uniref:histidine kinase n=1 Tax=Rhodovulum imhoffii TaxID=365340 RepID=A0A2T5BTD3_9RHOB|nr:ATP-binding protein [Rhodovulum imhoffii]MBK5932994.1 PAS domain-containing sensor histidine kinase [Rhodovulum imhoffii]PTN02664.1 two-component system nitrogen regulation sensor histidine kinase GlnL [Rhodovulum imhoffii]